jgi:nucleotide-binding universal stress UspA family protein
MSAIRHVSCGVGAPLFIVVHEGGWAGPLLSWGLNEVEPRNSGGLVVCVPDQEASAAVEKAIADHGFDRDRLELIYEVDLSAQSIRRRMTKYFDVKLLVGPLSRQVLCDLVFGFVDRPSPREQGPVIVIPTTCYSAPLPAAGKAIITVGFHGSAPASAALSWAVDEANRRDGQVQAVTAWSERNFADVGGSLPICPERHHVVGVGAEDMASAALERTGLAIPRVTSITRRGSPTGVLVKESRGSDLLVVGGGQTVVHGHRVLGPVTLGCVARSPVPVVIVPG